MVTGLLAAGIAVGVLLGIALRSGVTVPLDMPDYFWSVLCGDVSGTSSAMPLYSRFCANTREACARAVRNGMSSTVPEVG